MGGWGYFKNINSTPTIPTKFRKQRMSNCFFFLSAQGRATYRNSYIAQPRIKLQWLSQNTISGFFRVSMSAIGDHLSDHYICWTNYLDDRFSVLYKAWCKKYIAFLESISITLYYPALCRQKKKKQFDILFQFREFGGKYTYHLSSQKNHNTYAHTK